MNYSFFDERKLNLKQSYSISEVIMSILTARWDFHRGRLKLIDHELQDLLIITVSVTGITGSNECWFIVRGHHVSYFSSSSV